MNKFLRPTHTRHAGFSLIEVLIGAVILATGLLALSALQGSLARNAADSRIRSQVAAALESVAEADRGTSNFRGVPGAIQPVNPLPAGLGALDITVQNCNYRNLTTSENVNVCADKGGTVRQSQFKRVVYGASWTDSAGASRTMTLTSVVSPRTIAGSSPLPFSTPTQGVSGQLPIVRTPNPEVPGMIPIAIGDGSDTAATNPKPTINSGNVIRTSFEVLTYKSEGDAGIVKQQRRVETAVVGCSCNRTAPTGAQLERAQWPTYWNGTRYAIYQPSGNAAAPGTAAGTGSAGGNQDLLCTECCRDHHDTGTTGVVKFDPYRSDAHQHYKLTGTTLTVAGSSDNYLEVCRMVRVDGFWRTAQDMDAKHFGLLETENSARSPIPATLSAAAYETFAINFLKFNYIPGQTAQTAAALFEAGSLNAPVKININKPLPVDERLLHARGLYVDNVEVDTEALITTKCGANRTVDCVLPLLGFTSINVTETAFWESLLASQLRVDSDGFLLFDPANPNRGRVNAESSAVTADTDIRTLIGKSNSGLAARRQGIDPQDDVKLTDLQTFNVIGSGTASGASFRVAVINAPASNVNLGISWLITGNSGNNCQGPPPYSCSSVPLGAGARVRVSAGRYNTQEEVGGSRTITCPNSTSHTYSPNGQNTIRVCRNYSIASATVGAGNTPSTALSYIREGTVDHPGKVNSESANIDFASVSPGDVVTITFNTTFIETTAPIASCSFKTNGDLQSVIFSNCL